MAVMVKTLGFYSHKAGRQARGLSKLKAHLKYLEHGKVHENKPVGFDRDRDQVHRREFYEKVTQQPERGVIAHKLVFSLSQDERDRLGVSLTDVVRDVMSSWETRLGRPVNWIAYEHEDKGHPHVHVVVGGYAGDKQVGVYQRDLQWLRETADRSKEALSRPPKEAAGELAPTREADRLMNEVDALSRIARRFIDAVFGRDRGIERDR